MTAIQDLFAYNEWANERILDCLAGLTEEQFTRPLGSSFSSVRDTVAHVIGAEWIWLRRWTGTSPTGFPEWMAGGSVASLRARLAEIQSERREFLDLLSDSDLERTISYTNLKGESWSYALRDVLVHLVNHSTYHRGQIVTMVRQLGGNAPATDFLVFKETATPSA